MEIVIIIAAVLVLVGVVSTLVRYNAEPMKQPQVEKKFEYSYNEMLQAQPLSSTWPFPLGERPTEKKAEEKKAKKVKVTKATKAKPTTKTTKAKPIAKTNRKNK